MTIGNRFRFNDFSYSWVPRKSLSVQIRPGNWIKIVFIFIFFLFGREPSTPRYVCRFGTDLLSVNIP